MKKLTTLLMTLMLMSSALWADETITVSANSSDISEGLDLKVVAKLFAEAENLEQFEMMLNNPDSAFCNLDLNGDGQVDYLRVVETGEGNKRLIVLQAILAKDIYQDVASIYVEKNEKNEVSVQVVGDEYVYGTNYIIEPVYVYRPVIYDWFWGPAWLAWNSPWYWGYYPSWWYVHNCWAHDWYWHRCYAWHHHHHWCSFRPGRTIHRGYHELHSGVTRRDYAIANPNRSFSRRNNGMTNAREIRNTSVARPRMETVNSGRSSAISSQPSTTRTYGSANTAATRAESLQRSSASQSAQRTAATQRSTSEQRGTVTQTAQRTATTQRSTATRSTGSQTVKRSTGAQTVQRSTGSQTVQRSTGSATTQRSTATRSTATRSTSSTVSRSTSSSSSYGGSNRSSSSSSSRNSGSTYSGGSSRSGGYSGGGGHSSGGSRGGGGGGGGRSTRR